MDRTWIVLGALLAAVAVAAGAFGAHGLKERLSADDLDTFQTAARYQMYHALGLIAVGLLGQRLSSGALTAAGWLFLAGILFFSGALYLLIFSGVRALGAVAPVGGAAFIAGWLCLAFAASR